MTQDASGFDSSKQTHCTRCKKRYSVEEVTVGFGSNLIAQMYAVSKDERLPTQPDSIGYCEFCKQLYYAEHREQILNAYQSALDAYPAPIYIYGLVNPCQRLIYYIGRTQNLEQRMSDHRRDDIGQNAKAAYTRELHELGLTFEYCILSTVTPGYYMYEIEARWICYGLQQGWPLTNSDAQGSASHARFIKKKCQEPYRNFFTCSSAALLCGDRKSIRRIAMYLRWLETRPATLPDRGDIILAWRKEGNASIK